MKRIIFLSVAALWLVGALADDRSPSPAGAEVYFIGLTDGTKVSNPVTVRFGLKGMGVAPAGMKFDNTGHHHLLIDTALPSDAAQAIPAAVENKVLHFGKGQTEATLTLPPGKHTLQLVFGDYLHVPHNPAVVSKIVTITVTQ
jgi:hypothetical protein